MQITTIGIDLTKNVFQIHGADQRGKAVLHGLAGPGAEPEFLRRQANAAGYY